MEKTVFENLAEMNIEFYEISDCVKPHILFEKSEEFFKFLKHMSAEFVFVVKKYTTLNETIISDDLLSEYDKDIIREVSKDIKKYNLFSKEINYDIPISVKLCYIADKVCYGYVELTNSAYNEHNLGDPWEKLEEIIAENEELLDEMHMKRQSKLDAEKELLKEELIKEKEFGFCTNKNSRMLFFENFLKGDIKKRCPHITKQFLNFTNRKMAQAFVDMIYNEYKNRS